ncbi:MAG TPA: dienelactone hydrolase family protein [Anaerolineales bacterium]|nr:dienelactone hydrolase family protein [Anaerolineales bacterium]
MSALFDTDIRHATLVRTSPERVYAAFTTAEGLDSWFTSGASVDPRLGGEIRFHWVAWGPDGVTGKDGGPILEAQSPERFVFQWQPDNPDNQVGLVGFSLGAYWALQLVEERPTQIAAVVLFYGKKPGEYPGAQAAFLGHFAESDEFEPLASVRRVEKQIQGAGHPAIFHIYPGTGHWFFEADRPSAYDPAAAQLAWERTVAFLHAHLGGLPGA